VKFDEPVEFNLKKKRSLWFKLTGTLKEIQIYFFLPSFSGFYF